MRKTLNFIALRARNGRRSKAQEALRPKRPGFSSLAHIRGAEQKLLKPLYPNLQEELLPDKAL
jgi:hypothetical protein